MSAEARLKEKNITLPKPTSPMANYVGAVRTGNLLFVSGHGPVRDGRIHLVDGKPFSWHGPRIAEALRMLPRLIDPAATTSS